MNNGTKRITVVFFALLKEKTGQSRIEMDLPADASLGEMRTELAKRFPTAAAILDRSLASINQDFGFDEDSIPPGAEVGFFPPVSGGSEQVTIARITDMVIDLNTLLAEITDETTGAACIFTGMVRGVTRRGPERRTVRLEYEAYTPMAESKMRQVADEIRSRWPEVAGIAMVQRVGVLDPRTPTVLIACTAAHRDTGVFEASRYGIDRLKEIVPVWKKEISPDGEEWIEGDYRPTQEDRSL